MKKIILFTLLALLASVSAPAQKRFINSVAGAVKQEVLGSGSGNNNTSSKQQPEPSCACPDAVQVISLENMKLAYSEITINLLDDGSFLVMDRMSGGYYIIRDGTKNGPYQAEDPRVAPYLESEPDIAARYSRYISKSGDKYIIKFNGKTYGPYARISHFAVTRSGDKFAATAAETVLSMEDQSKQMEEAIEKAKTDQEKMELAMKFSQQMQQQMMAGGGPGAISPKTVTNIEGSVYNPMMAPPFTAEMKYDDIVYLKMTEVTDLKGQKLLTIRQQDIGNQIFIKPDNSGYASYHDGNLTLSDGKVLNELFNPYIVKTESGLKLAYLYYSPSKNAIMQCKTAW